MEESAPPGSLCCFCNTSHENEALYGKFYKIEDICTHYFCLLLSSKVQQRGSDNEGILGFLPNDIRDEVRRGKTLVCAYCHKRGATISCHNSKCKSHFHLPCGRAKDTFHQFFGEFKSFCFKHRKSQSIKKEVLKAMSGRQSTCSICLESVPATPSPNTLWAPCCSKEAWFHRLCIQRLALSAGYFFKCPLCNNTDRFVAAMRTCGIWIPEQDASWERDPNRYDGLLQRHNSCDAKSCRCRQGRTFHMESTKWEIKLCADCGSQGMHVHCGNLRVNEDWVCAICANVISSKKEEEKKKTGKILISRQAIRARNRARRGLPVKPLRTRLQLLRSAEEHKAEEEDTANVAAKSGVPSPGTIKETSSSSPVPSKDVVPRPVKPIASQPQGKELIPQTVQRATENSDVEIIDVGDDSDDEVQQWGSKKNVPLACTCKRSSRWSWHVRRPFESHASSCCYDRSKKYIHNGKSRSSRIKDSENDLLSRFFSTLASCSDSSLRETDPQCHHLFVIRHYQVDCSSERSHCHNGSPGNDGAYLKISSSKNVKLSQDSNVEAECSRMHYNVRKSNSLSKLSREKQICHRNCSQSKIRCPVCLKCGLEAESDPKLESSQIHSKMESRSSLRRTSKQYKFQSTVHEDSNSKSHARTSNSQQRTRISTSSLKPKSWRQGANQSTSQFLCTRGKSSCKNSENGLEIRRPRERPAARRCIQSCCEDDPSLNKTRCKINKRKLSHSLESGVRKKLGKNACVSGNGNYQLHSKDSPKNLKKNCTQKRGGCDNVGNGLALAKLPAYQPVVVIEPLLLRRERSASVERPVHRNLRLQGGRSRREQFLMQSKPRPITDRTEFQAPTKLKKQSPVQTRSQTRRVKSCEPCVKTRKVHNSHSSSTSVFNPPNRKISKRRSQQEQFLMKARNKQKRNRHACRTYKNYVKRSPVRTRSRSKSRERPVQTAEAHNTGCSSTTTTTTTTTTTAASSSSSNSNSSGSMFHTLLKNSDWISTRNPRCYGVNENNERRSSRSSSTESGMTPASDEIDWECIVDEDSIIDTIATMSEDSCFTSLDDETDLEIVVEEDNIKDTIAKIADLSDNGKCGFKRLNIQRHSFQQSAASNDNDLSISDASSSLLQNHLNQDTSPSFSTSVSSLPFSPSREHSHPASTPLSHSFTHSPECVSPHSSPSLASMPFSFPAPSAQSYSPRAHVDVSTFSNIALQSGDSSSSLPSNSLTSSISVTPSESKNLVSCKSDQTLPFQLPETLPSLPEPSESESANCPPSSFPSPRRSLRYSNNSVPSYNYRSTSNPLCVRRLSPPPIFPKRNGSLTEMEYRIKARTLTARKFVPMSRTATEQREMIRQLQGLQENQ